MARARHVTDIEDTQEYEDNHPDDNYPPSQSNCDCDHPINHRSATCRVNITQSPYLHVFYNQHPLRLTIDTADGRTPLSIVGETRLSLSRNGKTLTLEALVVEDLDVDILAGTPFMTCNDIAVRPAKHEIIIAGSDIVPYGSPNSSFKYHVVRYCHVLRAPPTNTTIWPGGFLEVDIPIDFPPDTQLAVEPRVDSTSCQSIKSSHAWPQPGILESVGRKLRLVNCSTEPIFIKKNDHICQARLVTSSSPPQTQVPSSPDLGPPPLPLLLHTPGYHSEQVSVDPDGIFSPDEKRDTLSLLKEFDRVFDPVIPGYNGAAGPIEGVVNMGSVQLPPPPAKRSYAPVCSRSTRAIAD
ncbi:Hypothetical predicted protein [Paramuricea clavata]|uniref:Uncharacterized protein n=1 Tax=Paramuricea clavata TaxID=317549 RepID=A0A7D9IML0_PARCT|nr:Hypothetical predicted protein [Paramuricea clavata]